MSLGLGRGWEGGSAEAAARLVRRHSPTGGLPRAAPPACPPRRAVPVDIVKSSVDQIIQYGKVVRPVMGISFAPDQALEQLGVSGVLVLDAREGGAAAKAGVRGTTRDDYGR